MVRWVGTLERCVELVAMKAVVDYDVGWLPWQPAVSLVTRVRLPEAATWSSRAIWNFLIGDLRDNYREPEEN